MRYVNRLSTITPHELEYNYYPWDFEDDGTYYTMKVTHEDDKRVKLLDFVTEKRIVMTRNSYERHLGQTLFNTE